MKPTVEQGLTARAVADGQELEVFNKEVIPVLGAARTALNYRSVYKATTNTADSLGAWKTIWQSDPIPANIVGLIEITVVGHDLNPFSYGARKSRLYVTDGGVLGGLLQTVIYEFLTAPPLNSRIFFDTPNSLVQVQVMDVGVAANFTAVIEVLEVAL